jgi:hypothetical protein
MFQYIFVSIIFTLILLFIIIKIKFPFWNIQPVFHTYDYWRYFYWTPFIVQKNKPLRTKFCDFEQIKTIPYLECSQIQQKNLENLIQCYYYHTDKVLHIINKTDIHNYLSGQNELSYVSFYTESVYSNNSNKIIDLSSIILNQQPIGCITSRYTKIFYKNSKTKNEYIELPSYFIDFICVHREHDLRKISRKLLQTHEYNQRNKNPSVNVSIIKKENILFEGIISLVEYKTTTYYLRNIRYPRLPQHFHIDMILNENEGLLIDFLYLQTHNISKCNNFDICIFPDFGSMISMIRQKLLYVFCLKKGEDIYGFYFLKDAKTQYDDIEGNTLHCFGSVMNYHLLCDEKQTQLFYLGFLHGLNNILKINNSYKILIIDETSNNDILLYHWRQKYTPIFKNNSAYYLYNFVLPSSPLSPNKCMILL